MRFIPTRWITDRSTVPWVTLFISPKHINMIYRQNRAIPPFAPTHWRCHLSIVPDGRRSWNKGLSTSRRSLLRRRRHRRVRVLGAARHGAPEAELPHRRQPGKGAAGREVKIQLRNLMDSCNQRRSQPLKRKSNFNLKYCTQ